MKSWLEILAISVLANHCLSRNKARPKAPVSKPKKYTRRYIVKNFDMDKIEDLALPCPRCGHNIEKVTTCNYCPYCGSKISLSWQEITPKKQK
jgi:ribosomal protein L32